MTEVEEASLDGLSFVDKLSQLDRGLQVFLSGLFIGLAVLVVTIVRMCQAAFSNEGGYGPDDIDLEAAPKMEPKPPIRPHATSQIRPISPNGKRASGAKSAKPSKGPESGKGDETHGSTRGKPSHAKVPPTASGGRKAPLGAKPLLRKSSSEKPSRTAPSFQPVRSKAFDEGASELTSASEDEEDHQHKEGDGDASDASGTSASDASDASVSDDDAPLLTRLVIQVAPAPHAHIYDSTTC